MSYTVNQFKKIILMAQEIVNFKVEDIEDNFSLFEKGLGFDAMATVKLIS